MSRRPWRVIAVRALTGELLHLDVPLAGSTTTRELSGPGGVFGAIRTELLGVVADDGRPLFEEWSTALFVEEAGDIKAGGIISRIGKKGTNRDIEAGGYAAYPTGIPYADNWLPNDAPDPTAVFAKVWSYVQSFPDADLGVTVDPVDTWMVVTNGTGPFRFLETEYRDCGDTLSSLAQTAQFDYLETHSWNSSHTGIDHAVKIGFPRLGRKRDDLRFADSENIIDFAALTSDSDSYANDVYVYGQGSGTAMIRSRAGERDGRLRRCAVVALPSSGGQTYVDTYAKRELGRRQLAVNDITEVTVQDHPNARISAIEPGDDIMFDAEVPDAGRVRLWLRVLAVTESGDSPGRATLKTQRSSSFAYPSDTSPTGQKVPIQI